MFGTLNSVEKGFTSSDEFGCRVAGFDPDLEKLARILAGDCYRVPRELSAPDACAEVIELAPIDTRHHEGCKVLAWKRTALKKGPWARRRRTIKKRWLTPSLEADPQLAPGSKWTSQ
jgi:hypothetical protein